MADKRQPRLVGRRRASRRGEKKARAEQWPATTASARIRRRPDDSVTPALPFSDRRGDYTADYNYQAAYFGVFSDNRPWLAKPFFDNVDMYWKVCLS